MCEEVASRSANWMTRWKTREVQQQQQQQRQLLRRRCPTREEAL